MYIHLMQAPQNICRVSIDINRIGPETRDILKLLGEQGEIGDAHTTEQVEKYISECLQVCTPKGAYVLAEAMTAGAAGEIRIPGYVFHCGNIIQKLLRHSQYYVFFMATAGPGPEFLARSLMNQGNYLEGYIVDLAASAMVDLVAGQIEEQVREHLLIKDLEITNRYSPGYCSWKVEEQKQLFSLFPEGCCGISLSSSCLMDPIKSISGIIGAGAGVTYLDHICEICSLTDCHFRQVMN